MTKSFPVGDKIQRTDLLSRILNVDQEMTIIDLVIKQGFADILKVKQPVSLEYEGVRNLQGGNQHLPLKRGK